MPITLNPQTNITMLDPDFVSVLNDLLKDTSLDASGIVAEDLFANIKPRNSIQNLSFFPLFTVVPEKFVHHSYKQLITFN